MIPEQAIGIAVILVGIAFALWAVHHAGYQEGQTQGHKEMSAWFKSTYYLCTQSPTYGLTNWKINCNEGETYNRP